jgi:hypothetical protein
VLQNGTNMVVFMFLAIRSKRLAKNSVTGLTLCSASLPPFRWNGIPFAVRTNREWPVFDRSELFCAHQVACRKNSRKRVRQRTSSGRAKLLGRRAGCRFGRPAVIIGGRARGIVAGADSARTNEVPLRVLFVRTVSNQAVAHSRLNM